MTAAAATKKPTKPLVRGDAIVQRVHRATIDELARVGYGALRIEDVAQRADVNKTTVYRRWPDKCALVRDALECMSGKTPSAPETGALRSDMLAIGQTLVDLAKRPQGKSIMRMLVAEGANPEIAEIKRDIRTERRIVPLAVLRAAVERGEIPADTDLQLLLDTFIGAVHHRVYFMNVPVKHECLEKLVDLLLEGARAKRC